MSDDVEVVVALTWHYPGICLEGLRKSMNISRIRVKSVTAKPTRNPQQKTNISPDERTEEKIELTSRYSPPFGLDSNLVPPEYEARLNGYVQRGCLNKTSVCVCVCVCVLRGTETLQLYHCAAMYIHVDSLNLLRKQTENVLTCTKSKCS
jgi:hypothetical protein